MTDRVKDHINMHFIRQVKKRKAENDIDSHTSDDSNEINKEHLGKKVKKEDDLVDEHNIIEEAKIDNLVQK